MSLIVVSNTPAAITNVAEAKRWCRIDNQAEDDIFQILIDGAMDYVSRVSRLDIGQIHYALRLDSFPTPNWYRFYPNLYPYPQLITIGLPFNSMPAQTIQLPVNPVISVDGITYYDTQSVLQTVDPSKYSVDLANGRIAPIHNTSWAMTDNRLDAVVVSFTAGFSSANYPKLLKMAVLNYVLLAYQYRDGIPDKAKEILDNACIGLRENYLC